MRRPLIVVTLALFILSTAPQLPVTVVASSGPQLVDYMSAGYYYKIAVSTTAHTAILVWLNETGDHLHYMLNSTSTFETIKEPTLLPKMTYVKEPEFDVATNGTHYMIVASNHTGSQYDVFYFIIDASTGDIVKGPEVLFNSTHSERRPVVEWGGDYWLVATIDRDQDAVNATFVNKAGDPTYTYKMLGTGIVYDGRDLRIAYNPDTNKFAVVASTNGTDTLGYKYDIALYLIDPGTFTTVRVVNVTNDDVDDYRYARQGAVLAPYGNGFIVFWADRDKNLKFANVSSNGDKVVYTIGTALSNGIWPDITTSAHGVVVAWRDSSNYKAYVTGEIKVTIIKNNNANTYTVATTGYYPSIARISQDEAVVVYGDGNGNVKASRINLATGDVGLSIVLASDPDPDVQYEKVEADDALEIGVYGYSIYDTYPLYWGSFAKTELPSPTLTSTEIVDVEITLSDLDGDNFVEAGEKVVVTGRLVEAGTMTGISDQKINVELYYWIPYTNESVSGVKKVVASTEVKTGTDGSFTAEITIPSTIVTQLYGVRIGYPGNTTLNYGSASYDTPASDAFILYKTAPTFPTWETVPSDIAPGPAILYSNGQVIITDPEGDYANITPSGIPEAEASELDLRVIQLAIDNNYLYVRVEVAGNPGLDGEIAPIIMLAFDFTPENPDDGGRAYDGNVPLYYPWDKYSDTRLPEYRRWDLGITLAPVHSTSHPVVDADHKTKGPLLYVLNRTNNIWFETAAGYIEFGTNYVVAAIPLDIVRWGNDALPTTGLKDVLLYAAVFAENISDPTSKYGYIIDRDRGGEMDVFDIAGGYPWDFTGTHLDQGWKENYRGNALDTRFILNIDLDNNRFFGYTETYITATNMTVTGFGELRYDGPRSFVGEVKYIARLRDANNTYYYVYGKTLELYVNETETPVYTATTDAVGIAELSYTWSANNWKKNHTIYVKFAGDSDYVAAESKHYEVRTLYLINITDLTYEFIDNDGDELITRGDQLKIVAEVEVWDGSAWVTAPDGVGVKFVLHSPEVVLGTNTTKNGEAMITYTFTGDEYLLGSHEIVVGGDGETSWKAVYPGVTWKIQEEFSVLPLPEAPVMPIILLAALLLFIIVKKRK